MQSCAVSTGKIQEIKCHSGMEKRDILKDQIEQLGKVLARILSQLEGLKSEVQISQGIDLASEQLRCELEIEIDGLVNLTKKELEEYLKHRKFTAEHVVLLSACLKEIGKVQMEKKNNDAIIKFEKAIELLDIADEISQTVSFDRINRKNE